MGNNDPTQPNIPEYLNPQNLKSHMNAVIYHCMLVPIRLCSLYCVNIWDAQGRVAECMNIYTFLLAVL
jgi:hypothetical protein